MTEPARPLTLVSDPTPEPPDPLIGELVDGRYRVEGVLGKGGMGLVYRARHQVLGKQLALKVLRPEVSRDSDVMERFRREAQSASAIGSPHICDVSDFGSLPDGSTYFVMEFLDGPSLTDAIEAARPMPTERIVAIASQLCEALGAAHARDIVHRDLKPDNVHLVPRGANPDFVKVLDFGIAKVAGGADKKLTQAGQIFGTPHYMSPEQCSGREVDLRTDIYALGVMLYEMACGRVPFDADTLMGVLTKHVYEVPIHPHQMSGVSVDPGLEAVILKCLAKRPEDRYPSMAALRADLETIERGATPGAVRDGIDRAIGAPSATHAPFAPAVVPAVDPQAAPKRSRGLLFGLGAAALLLLAGAGAVAVTLQSGALAPTETASSDVRSTAPERDSTQALGGDGERVATAERPTDTPTDTPRDTSSATQTSSDTPGAGATAPEPAMIHLITQPPNALVLDASGATVGSTPLDLARPEQGTQVEYRVQLPGHREITLPLSARTGPRITLQLVAERRASSGRRGTGQVATEPATGGTPAADTPTSTRPQRDRDLRLSDGIINPFP